MSAVLQPISQIDPLAQAVQAYVEAKRAEDQAKVARLAAEDRILALQAAKEEGATTIDTGGFKLTLTGKHTYSCEDPRALAEACAAAQWSPTMIPVKTETVLDATGAKWLRVNQPEAWQLVARFVTVKPAKTAVTVKV